MKSRQRHSIYRSIINSVSRKSRGKKLNQFLTLLTPVPQSTILEVGVANIEYSPIDNYLIKKYAFRDKITALGIGDFSEFKSRYSDVVVVAYDGNVFPFKDCQFDIAHSNAVIEHVGTFNRQAFFLKEMVRVAHSGMITTPNRYFPIEVHTKIWFLHWFPKSVFDKILSLLGKSWAAGDYMNLLALSDLKRMIDSVGMKKYRIIRNRFMGLTMTFTLLWSNN